ncbi:MAG: tripartite tricarboxylate transporter substrate binding protein [Burkholderiales bacterium]|nr:MAG: tripartite tricarboxylate transporter substrate binding protein [Burkholderiales bacterium]
MLRRQFLQMSTAMASPWALSHGHAQAPAYPNRPITILQGFAAGGNADTIARTVGNELAKTLGQPVVVEAKAGAGGTIAAGTVARAQPDGHSLLLATGGHTAAGALYKSLPYKTVDDFAMVSTITFFPFLLVTQADAKPATLAELLAKAKAAPGTVSYGSAGIGSTHHMAVELLARMSRTQLLHVPYRGDSASLGALLSGDIPLIIAPPTAVMANIKAGKLRAIATTGAQRWPGLPDVPTVAEQGVAGYDVSSWAGLMAPAGTPRPIVDRLNAEVQKVLQLPAVRTRLEDMGGEVRGSTPEEMRAMVAAQTEKWTQVVAEAKIPQQ